MPSISKTNINRLLNELSKVYKKISGRKTPAEIIIVGGASVLINYGFRESTMDIDAIITASSAMKEAIQRVADSNGLSSKWLNDDFEKTKSYSPKIVEHSVYYKTFSQILEVRTIKCEYLIAMKLRAGRVYKNDLSDIVGLIKENKDNINYDQIIKAFKELYGTKETIPKESLNILKLALDCDNLDDIYNDVRKSEKTNFTTLKELDKNSPSVLKQGNVNEILIKLNKNSK